MGNITGEDCKKCFFENSFIPKYLFRTNPYNLILKIGMLGTENIA